MFLRTRYTVEVTPTRQQVDEDPKESIVIRDMTNNALRKQLDDVTDPWGIKVDRVELKDIDLDEFGTILAEQRATETRRRT
ncbi:MAG: regulator of protease activity HflC (stomatin/prohibitin superfamily) [Kiritimatiellia bacterium]